LATGTDEHATPAAHTSGDNEPASLLRVNAESDAVEVEADEGEEDDDEEDDDEEDEDEEDDDEEDDDEEEDDIDDGCAEDAGETPSAVRILRAACSGSSLNQFRTCRRLCLSLKSAPKLPVRPTRPQRCTSINPRSMVR
jgi:hypothetical protein